MALVHEQLSERFYQWEMRGRGWQVFPEPVFPEPPFVPFRGHFLPEPPAVDDGRRPTLLSSLVRRLSETLSPQPSEPPPIPESEPEPRSLIRETLIELQTSLPAKLDLSKDAFEQFLLNLSLCREPITFELLGANQRIAAQFAVHPQDAPLVRRQLQSFFPEAEFVPRESLLELTWDACPGDDLLIMEFGLAREFMLPLSSGKLDPFVGIVGALAELAPGELGLFQVMFQPVREAWPESVVRSVTHADGKPFFVNSPELAKAAEHKVAKPLYAAVVRVALRTESEDRTLQLARDLAGSLRVFAHPQGNELIPLSNEDYPFEDHIDDALRRQSRRSGMLLNSEELIGFVHLPSSAVRSPALERETGRSKAAPAAVRHPSGIELGTNVHAGQSVSVRLTPEQRVRHTHIVGATGTGKSTLLFNLIQQDIENGEGVAVLDPHGDLVDRILGSLPEHRLQDVVLIDPADEGFSVGFNILTAHSDTEKNLLASDLVAVFERLSTSWGDQMGIVLQNAILAFLESSRGGTLSDLRRFLIDNAYRNEFLTTVNDPEVVFYWKRSFPQLTGNRSIGPVLTRLETFLAPKPIRYMVSQTENRLDFADIMDSGKILLARLSQGQIGDANTFLLGSLIVAKLQQATMSRQRLAQEARRDFWLYIDEFHHFITPSMAGILTGVRKYRLGLILAHHELRQLQRDPEVAAAVLSTCHTRIVFRVGDADARALADGFAGFEAHDLQNLELGKAIARVERRDCDFNLAVSTPHEPDPASAAAMRHRASTVSREKFAKARAVVEAELLAKMEASVEEEPAAKPKTAAKSGPKASEAEVKAKTADIPNPNAPEEQATPPPTETAPITSEAIQKAKSPAVDKPKPEPVPSPAFPADLGMGGAQHKAIQHRLKREAEALGFHATVEKEIVGGSVDLALERGDQTIACEITVTNTIDYEVGNIAKCVKAGFTRVVLISQNEERLRKIEKAITTSLGPEVSVGYFQPDQFISELRSLAPAAETPTRSPDLPTTRRGYKVKRKTPAVTEDERKAREAVALKLIADSMRRPSV